MTEAAELLKTQALPFFSRTSSVAGLCKRLDKERWGSEHHLNFEIGCCLARLQRYSEAEDRLQRAAKLYEKDGREWCSTEAARVYSLLTAIEAGQADALLHQWIEDSVAQLRLSGLLGAQQAVAADRAQARAV